jgi:aspartate-semialdehyde dehydrogenase
MGAAAGRRVAIVGATGAVGGQLLELIEEHGFPYSDLKLFAQEEGSASAGENRDFLVFALRDPSDLTGFDVAFLAAPPSVAAEIVRARPGPVLIDLSGATRTASSAPLAAPGLIARDAIAGLAAEGVIEVPHPAAHVVATILVALDARDEFVAATVMLGASASGNAEIAALMQQSADLMNARLSLEDDETQVAFNLFAPERESEIAAAIASQVARLVGHAPKLSLQAVQVPVPHGTALAIHFSTATDLATTRERLRAAPGLLLVDDDSAARGTADAVGRDAALVATRNRAAGIALWCLFDSARLAALDALWIAENLRPENGLDAA